MSNKLDSVKLSDIIQSSTNEIINQIENFIQSIDQNTLGKETVSIMLNGVETTLNLEDYNLLKTQNDEIKLRMKADIKTLITRYKSSLNN